MKNYVKKWCFSSNAAKYLLIVILLKTITARASIRIQDDTDDFESLILNNYLYIDKTMLINEYFKLSSKNTSTMLTIHRPEGWGKTTNIKMLEKFLQIEVNDRGEPQPEEATINTKLFLGGSIGNNGRKLNPLKIANSQSTLQHLGNHPVILLDLKNATGNAYEEIEHGIKSSVMDAYRVHRYLIRSPRVTDKDKLQNYLSGELDVNDLITSVYFLSKKLYEHFNKKVHVLIDDYDIPLMTAIINNFTVDYQEVKNLLQNIYKYALNENPYRSMALLVGVYPFDVSVNATTLDYMPILSIHPIIEFFGFTSNEVKTMIEELQIETDLEELQNWYGGYYLNGVKDHYNPRSVIRFLANNGTFAYYGPCITTNVCEIESSEYDAYTDESYYTQSDQVISTLAERELFKSVDGVCHLITSNLINSHPVYSGSSWFDEHFKEKLILLYNGYLSLPQSLASGEQDVVTLSELYSESFEVSLEEFIVLQTLQLQYSELSIPNYETRYFYELKAFQWICYMFETDIDDFTSFVQLLSEDLEMEDFLVKISHYLAKPKVHDYLKSANQTKIELYHAFMFSIKHVLSSTHTMHGNKDTKDENQIHRDIPIYQPNMIFVPKSNQSDTVIIISYEMPEKFEYEMLHYNPQDWEPPKPWTPMPDHSMEKIDSVSNNVAIPQISQHLPVKTQIKMILFFYEDEVAAKYVIVSPKRYGSGELFVSKDHQVNGKRKILYYT